MDKKQCSVTSFPRPGLLKSYLAALFAALLPMAGLGGCSWFSDDTPEIALLEKRTTALITLGWPWLKVENMRIAPLSSIEGGYAATCAYDLVLQADITTLPDEERARYARFLPMCVDTAKTAGERCPVREDMRFVNTKDFGWMPEPVILYAPNLLPDIAAWQP